MQEAAEAAAARDLKQREAAAAAGKVAALHQDRIRLESHLEASHRHARRHSPPCAPTAGNARTSGACPTWKDS